MTTDTSSDAAPGNSGDEPAGRPIPQDSNALLYPAEVAHLLGVGVRTLESWRLRGGGPTFVSLSRRAVRYRRRDVLAYIDDRRRRSTSDPGEAAAATAAEG